MEVKFPKTTFSDRLKSMLKVDFKRMFTMPLVYIMAGISLVIPVLILVMTSLMGGSEDSGAAESFTNVWQTLGSVSGTQMSMDLTGMCNLNMMYFLIPIFVCIFVADDFKSGYAKNLFTVRSGKTDYCISKTVAGFAGGTIMILSYFIGALIGGAIAGLSFDAQPVGAGGIAACLFSKIFLTLIFVSIALILGVAGKQRLWISVVGSLAAGMLLFTMLPMISPLDSNFLNVVMCFAGGLLFAVGLGAASNVILNKISIL